MQRFEASIRAVRAETERVERRTRTMLVALLVAAPLLALAVSVLVGRSVAAPVARLEQGAARIAEGDLDTRIEVRGAPELEALADRWNAMTASLKDHQAQLVESEKLAGIGRLAAGVAHEINNPLGVILGYAKLLRKQAAPAAAEDLAVIEEETLRAKAIVDGLLDLSRPLPAGAEPVDLRALSRRRRRAPARGARSSTAWTVSVDGAASAPGHAGEAAAGAREPRAERRRGGGARAGGSRWSSPSATGARRGRRRGLGAGDPAARCGRASSSRSSRPSRAARASASPSRAPSRARTAATSRPTPRRAGGARFALRLPRGPAPREAGEAVA